MRYEFTIREGLTGRRGSGSVERGQLPPRCRGCGNDCEQTYCMCQHKDSFRFDRQLVPICGSCARKLEYWAERLCPVVSPDSWTQFVVLPKPSARMLSAMEEEDEIEAARQRHEKLEASQ